MMIDDDAGEEGKNLNYCTRILVFFLFVLQALLVETLFICYHEENGQKKKKKNMIRKACGTRHLPGMDHHHQSVSHPKLCFRPLNVSMHGTVEGDGGHSTMSA